MVSYNKLIWIYVDFVILRSVVMNLVAEVLGGWHLYLLLVGPLMPESRTL
jgi:hypothetical protein